AWSERARPTEPEGPLWFPRIHQLLNVSRRASDSSCDLDRRIVQRQVPDPVDREATCCALEDREVRPECLVDGPPAQPRSEAMPAMEDERLRLCDVSVSSGNERRPQLVSRENGRIVQVDHLRTVGKLERGEAERHSSTSIRGARASPRGWNEEDLTPFLRASAGLGLVAGRLPVNRSARPAQPERKHRRPATDLGLAGNGRMPPVTDVGEPGAGKQHARFDGAREEASASRPRPHGVRRLPPTRPTSSYEIALGQPLPPPGRSQETNTCSTSDCHGRGVCPGPARGRSPRPLASLRGYEVHSSGGVAEMTWVGLPGGRM
ncbi:MAG: hypothetical protein HW413_1711, partial [Thermoleophilia bacterium]|nr:hypothetical protein [Thermoleophilia bacterium]